jgi:hypothetical protein
MLRRLFSFLDLRWDERYLDIPYVNRSETPFNLESDARGINQTRVFYYRGILSEAEELTVRAFGGTRLLATYYPELQALRKKMLS